MWFWAAFICFSTNAYSNKKAPQEYTCILMNVNIQLKYAMVSNRSVICPTNARANFKCLAHIYIHFAAIDCQWETWTRNRVFAIADSKIFHSSGVCTSEYCQCHFSSQTKRCAQTINLNLMNLEHEAKKTHTHLQNKKNGTWQWTLSFPIFGGKIAFAIYFPWVSFSRSSFIHSDC